nr:hypothetical protein CUSKHUHK_CUSKHUHK_CDS_0006 [Microvirus sp.]
MLKRPLQLQDCPTVSPRYEFNDEMGELEEVGIRDDFAFVQSSADSSFQAILNRIGYFDNTTSMELYDPKAVKFVDDVPVVDDLEEVGYTSYADFLEKIQEYAEKRGLPGKYTPEQIIADMREQAALQLEKIKFLKEQKENEVSESVEKTDK